MLKSIFNLRSHDFHRKTTNFKGDRLKEKTALSFKKLLLMLRKVKEFFNKELKLEKIY